MPAPRPDNGERRPFRRGDRPRGAWDQRHAERRWSGRRVWGWRLSVVIIAVQVLGDLANILMGHFVRGAAGVTIAGGLLFYVLRPGVRAAFVARRAVESEQDKDSCRK